MNVYELQAREAKAKRIADWLRVNQPDVDADIAAMLNEDDQAVIASMAGVKNPPSDETWMIVLSELRRPVRPVRAVPADPFDGLPS